MKKWGAHSEEMRSILKKCAGRSRDDWIGKEMCQQSECVSATDFFVFKSMFPSESLDLQSWPWLVVCQGAWEHTFRNMFRSICQDVVFILVTNDPNNTTGLPPSNQCPDFACGHPRMGLCHSIACQSLAFSRVHSVLHPLGVSWRWHGALLHVYSGVLVGAFQTCGITFHS